MTSSQPPSPAQVFDEYLGPAMFRPWAEIMIEVAEPQEGETVLDLACATGTVARMIAESGVKVAKLHGLDSSAAMLEVARERSAEAGFDIEWAEGVCEDLPYGDATFDLVVCQQGLQFFKDREKSVQEIYRVLKPGGRLVANVWHGLDYHTFLSKLFDAVSERLGAPVEVVGMPFMLGDADELRRYVKAGGFASVDVVGYHHLLQYPEPQRMVQISVMGAAAAIPAFADMSPEQRAELAQGVAESLKHEIASATNGDFIDMPSATNVAVARK